MWFECTIPVGKQYPSEVRQDDGFIKDPIACGGREPLPTILMREAVAESAAAVADYRAGSERALNFVVGLVMKKTRGKADAGEVHRLVKEEVEKA